MSKKLIRKIAVLPKEKVESKLVLRAPPPLCPVTTAVHLLMNNNEGDAKVPMFNADMVGVARSLFSAYKEYSFRLHNFGTQAFNGSGVFAPVALGWASLGTGAVEWSALQSLFDMVKLTKVTLRLNSGVASSTAMPMCIVGVESDINGVNPASFSVVLRNTPNWHFHPALMTGGSGHKVISFSTHKREFAITSSTPYASSPPAGLIGQFNVATTANGPASALLFTYVIHLDVTFTNRA